MFEIIIGCFLPWVSGSSFFPSILGVEISQGAVTLLAGVLCLAALILVPSDARSKRGQFFLFLGALILALVFQSVYTLNNHDYPLGAGLWMSLAGGFLIIGAGGFDTGVFTYIAAKSSQTGQK